MMMKLYSAACMWSVCLRGAWLRHGNDDEVVLHGLHRPQVVLERLGRRVLCVGVDTLDSLHDVSESGRCISRTHVVLRSPRPAERGLASRRTARYRRVCQATPPG